VAGFTLWSHRAVGCVHSVAQLDLAPLLLHVPLIHILLAGLILSVIYDYRVLLGSKGLSTLNRTTLLETTDDFGRVLSDGN
jgi:hypothetical protein